LVGLFDEDGDEWDDEEGGVDVGDEVWFGVGVIGEDGAGEEVGGSPSK
jgi:hypothetical protein